MSTPCPTYEPLIADALFGELSPEDRQRLDRHVDTCDACAKELRSMQATLQITARRERPEPPSSFWHGYWPRLVRRMERDADRNPSLATHLAAWWRTLTEVPPAMRWALQGAVAVALVIGGFWLGRQPAAPGTSDDVLFGAEEPAATLPDLMPAVQSPDAQRASTPMLTDIEDITYDVSAGTVEIRYNAVSDVIVRGTPDDPAIQQLLQTAMLDDQDPAARLNALQAVEKTRPSANTDLVQALTYLAQTEQDAGMRLRAVRALRALQQETGSTLRGDTRDVLINLLLNASDGALRIEALQALMDSAPSAADPAPDYLYEVQNDSNSYVRYQAQQALQRIGTSSSSDPLNQ
jgi:HEAT repeat protein